MVPGHHDGDRPGEILDEGLEVGRAGDPHPGAERRRGQAFLLGLGPFPEVGQLPDRPGRQRHQGGGRKAVAGLAGIRRELTQGRRVQHETSGHHLEDPFHAVPPPALPDGSESTYGRRYVFSRLERSILSAELRADYAFSPGLSLELFAQPFAAGGDYHGFGELREPDFRRVSFRSTAVLRWQWRPGSTLFLAWQQNRARVLTPGGPPPVRASTP